MRFIFNFIFFGILFYLIYLFFPDAFNTLVSWVNHIYLFLKDLVLQLYGKVHTGGATGPTPPAAPEHAAAALLQWFR